MRFFYDVLTHFEIHYIYIYTYIYIFFNVILKLKVGDLLPRSLSFYLHLFSCITGQMMTYIRGRN